MMFTNGLKHHKKLKNFTLNIFSISFLYIIINISIANSFKFFRSMSLTSNDFLLINENGIYIYNSNNEQTLLKQFATSEKLSEDDMQYISFSKYSDGAIILKIKNKIYIISNEIIICEFSHSDEIFYTSLLSYEPDIENYYNYILSYIKNENQIYMTEYVISISNRGQCTENTKNLKLSSTMNKFNEIISCNLLYDDIMSCFINSNEILYLHFYNIKNSFELLTEKETSFNMSKNITLLKSVLSEDKKSFLVCYKNNENIYCIIFDINNNKWSKEVKIFDNCISNNNIDSMDINYFNETKEYLIFCRKNDYTLNIMQLDNNYIVKVNNKNFDSCYIQYSSNNNLVKTSFIISYSSLTKKYFELSAYSSNYDYLLYNEIPEFCNKETNIFYFFPVIDIQYDKYYVIKNLQKIINNIEIGKQHIFYLSDYSTVKISPINNQIQEGSIITNFSECEKILRKKYSLSSNDILTLFQIEFYINNEYFLRTVINQVEYAIFDDKKNMLDLNLCKNLNFTIEYNITQNYLLDFNKINYYLKNSIDIFDINSEFFTEICYSYSENGTDIILADRISYIFQNLTICEKNCDYKKIDIENLRIICECEIKTNITSEYREINFANAPQNMNYSHFHIIYCPSFVFDIKNIKSNIGFYIFLILLISNITTIILYCMFDFKSLKSFIFSEMNKNNYLISDNNPPPKNKGERFSLPNIPFHNNLNNINNLDSARDTNSNNKINISNTPIINNICIKEDTNIIKKRKSILKHRSSKSDIKSRKSLKRGSRTDFLISNNIKRRPSSIGNKFLSGDKALNNFKFNDKNKEKNKDKENDNGKEKDNNYGIIVKRNTRKRTFSGRKRLSVIREEDCNEKDEDDKKDDDEDSDNEIEEKNCCPGYYKLIQIDANSYIRKKRPFQSDFNLINYDFEQAINYDDRSFWRVYYIYILNSEIIFHTFVYHSFIEPISVRISLFLFKLACEFFFNGLFFSNPVISNLYKYNRDNSKSILSNEMAIIFCTIFISFIIESIFNCLINSKYDFEKIFKHEEKIMRNNKKYYLGHDQKLSVIKKTNNVIHKANTKNIIFFILELCLMLFFSYYIIAFCAIYGKTQINWIYNSLITIFIMIVLELILTFTFASIYSMAVNYKIELFYHFSLLLYKLG